MCQIVFNVLVIGGLFDLLGGEFFFVVGVEYWCEEGLFILSEYQWLGQGCLVLIQGVKGDYYINEIFVEFLVLLFNFDWDLFGLYCLDVILKGCCVVNLVVGGFNVYIYGIQYELFVGIQLCGSKIQLLCVLLIVEFYILLQLVYYNILEVCLVLVINGGINFVICCCNCEVFFQVYLGVDLVIFQVLLINIFGLVNGYIGLKNEKVKFWIVGIVFVLDWVKGLCVVVDWYDIKIIDVIISLSLIDIIIGCFDNLDFNVFNVFNVNCFCSLVMCNLLMGVVIDICIEYGNGLVLMFRGWMVEVDYNWDMGWFGQVVLGFYGYMLKNCGQVVNVDVLFVECVGMFEEFKCQFCWMVQYVIGKWSYGVMFNYMSGLQFSLIVILESWQYFKCDSWMIWDVNVSYYLIDNVCLNLLVLNLFDDIGLFLYVLDVLGCCYMVSFCYSFC